MFESWRGVVGDIKPTHRPGSLEEFIRLLPEGIGVIPLTVGIRSGTEKEFHDVLELYRQKAADLADLGVNLIHIGGAPPMTVHGFSGEDKIVKELEAKHKVLVSTSGKSQTDVMRALGIKRFVGVTYFKDNMNEIFTRYFTEAGFEVAAMEGIAPRSIQSSQNKPSAARPAEYVPYVHRAPTVLHRGPTKPN